MFEQEPEERRKHADDRARVFQTQETARTKAGSQEEPALQEEIVYYMIIKKSVINRSKISIKASGKDFEG